MVFEEKAYYKMSNFVSFTLIGAENDQIKTGPEVQLYEMINQNENSMEKENIDKGFD